MEGMSELSVFLKHEKKLEDRCRVLLAVACAENLFTTDDSVGEYVPYCSAVVQRMTLYIPSVFATEFTAPKASGMLAIPSPAEAEAAATATAATFWRSRTRSWGSTAHRCCTSQHISDGKKKKIFVR